jgi:hypothetical protein
MDSDFPCFYSLPFLSFSFPSSYTNTIWVVVVAMISKEFHFFLCLCTFFSVGNYFKRGLTFFEFAQQNKRISENITQHQILYGFLFFVQNGSPHQIICRKRRRKHRRIFFLLRSIRYYLLFSKKNI